MFIDKVNLLNLFAKDYNSKNPNISENVVKEVVLSQYRAIRNYIESEEIPHIRLKYFGLFRPLYGRLNHYRKGFFEKNNITGKEQGRYEKIFKKVDERFPKGLYES